MAKDLNPVDRLVGARIAARREALGLTQGELAARLDLDIDQVRDLETGEMRASAERLRDLARILAAPVSSFLPRSPDDLARPG